MATHRMTLRTLKGVRWVVTINLQVKITRLMKLRLMVGIWFIRLAAGVMGCDVTIQQQVVEH